LPFPAPASPIARAGAIAHAINESEELERYPLPPPRINHQYHA